MKTLLAIPENKEERKEWFKTNKKKIIGGAVTVGLTVTGLFVGTKLSSKKDRNEDSDETPFLPEAEVNEEENNGFMDEESKEEKNEESDETTEEGDAE